MSEATASAATRPPLFSATHSRRFEAAARDFARLIPWGTPEQVVEKLRVIRDLVKMDGFMPGLLGGFMILEVANWVAAPAGVRG